MLACARTRMSAEVAARVRTLISGGVDWQVLIAAAAAHCVTPLVGRSTSRRICERGAVEVRALFRVAYERTVRGNLLMTAEMLRLSGRFRAEGMIAVPYKGPLLAAQAYGDFGLRQFVDLDFAIRQRDLPRATALLAADGYKAVFGAISPEEATHPSHSEYQFVRADRGVVLEMQTEVTLRYFPRKLDFDDLEKRLNDRFACRRRNFFFFAGGHAHSSCSARRKAFLGTSAVDRGYFRIVASSARVDWAQAFSLAKEMGVSRPLNLALYLAHRMLEAPLPDDVREQVFRDRAAKTLGDGICERFSMQAQAELPVFSRFRFRVASRDSLLSGLRFAMRLATSPTEPDRADMPLPEGMSGIHRWLRPVLLMKRHGIRRPKSGDRR